MVEHMAIQGHSVTAAALSQLELGHSTPTGKTLLAIAESTKFPLEYFVRRNADAEVDGFFRSLRSAPVRERRWAVAQAHLVHDFVRVLEHHVELPDLDFPHIKFGGHNRTKIDEAAALVRRKWKLDDGPIQNVVRECERHGLIATRLPLGRHDLDAFSVWFDDRPIVVLGTDKGSTARSRFDAAHELGHGVLHDGDDIGTKAAEDEAHRFAAAFLMPEPSIRPYLSASVDWRELMDVKARWGVSLGALLRRAKDLEILSPQRYVSAMKYMSARGWRKSEPGDQALGNPEQPRLVSTALHQLNKDGIHLTEIVEEAGLPLRDVQEALAPSTGARTRVDL
jgi:Zn-dependent peptidase ImmA (M78 family)/transcriptional regulator with XRE-family HTH domain